MQRKIRSVFMVAILLTAGLLLLLCLPSANVAATKLFVSNTNPSTYNTIQSAIDAASDGDIIVVENGSYTESLTFTALSGVSKLTIKGNGSVSLMGTTGNPTLNVDGTQVATLNLVNLTLSSDNTGEVEVYTGGTVNCVGTNFTTINVDGTSTLRHMSFITPTVYYLGGTEPVEAAELKWQAGSTVKYASMYYSGTDGPTSPEGNVGYPFIMQNAEYVNGNTPSWNENWVWAYKASADFDEVSMMLDTNTSGPVDLILSKDIRAPDVIANVMAETLSQTSINVSWDATAEVGFTNYTVYTTDATGVTDVFLANTTETWFVDTGLAPSTIYYYEVTVTDASGFESIDSAVASNTTLDPVNGTVQGTAKLGPITRGVGGGGDSTIVVALLNATITLAQVEVNETEYNFTFTGVDFEANLTVYAEPKEDVDKGAIGVQSGWLPKQSAEFEVGLANLVQTEDIVLDWYEYIPPLPVLSGKITYEGGDLDGLNATDAAVKLYQHMEEFDAVTNATVVNTTLIDTVTANNITGNYTFIDVTLGKNYTIMASPITANLGVIDAQSGYLADETDWFNITMDKTVDLALPYYEYIPPNPVIDGQVMYSGGPLNGTNATGVKVEVIQRDSVFNTTLNATVNVTTVLATLTTNGTTGMFTKELTPGKNISLRVSPKDADLFVDGNQSGYEAAETAEFALVFEQTKTFNLSLKYKEWVPPLPVLVGTITYKDGPRAGTPGANATINVKDGEGTTIKTGKANETGHFQITGIPAGLNFTVEILGLDAFAHGESSGYVPWLSPSSYNLSRGETQDLGKIELEWAEWNPPPEDDPEISIGTIDTTKKYQPGETITLTGTSKDIDAGTTVTVTIDGQSHTTAIGADGGWSVTFPVPDADGDYQIVVSADGETDSVVITVEETKKDDDGLSGMTLALIVIIILVVIVVVVIIVVLLMKKKPEDEEEQDDGEFECPECSALVSADVDTCPECGESFEEEEFRCPECGAQIDKDSGTCDECGTDFEGGEDEEEEGEEDEEEEDDEDEDDEEEEDDDEEEDEEDDDEDEDDEEEEEDYEVEIEEDDE